MRIDEGHVVTLLSSSCVLGGLRVYTAIHIKGGELSRERVDLTKSSKRGTQEGPSPEFDFFSPPPTESNQNK